MAEITYRGVTYTDDRLTFRFDKVKGEYRASLDGYYHAIGWPKDLAVRRLSEFLQATHPDVWRGAKDRLAEFFNAHNKEPDQ
jgi:hypothetical protein